MKGGILVDKNGACHTLLAPYIIYSFIPQNSFNEFHVIFKKAIEIKPRPQVIEGQLVATILNNMMKLLN